MNKSKSDLMIVLLIIAVVYFLAVVFDWAERLTAIANMDESLQLDEIPIVLFVAALMTVWFSTRRLHDLQQESTIRAKAEAGLAESQRLYKRLFDEGLSGNFVASIDGNIILANDVFSSMSGRYASQLNLNLILGDQWNEIFASLQLKHHTDFFELTAQRHDGAPWIVSARFTYAVDTINPELSRIHGFFYDITEQYLAEKELAKLLSDNQQLIRHAMKVQEDERKNLAREIHDDMGQYLTAIRMDALAIKNSTMKNMAELSQRISSHAEHIQASVKALIKRLRPPELDAYGLVEALNLLIEEWQLQHADTKCELFFDHECSRLPPDISLIAYRLAQEALTNVARHAEASLVNISVKMTSRYKKKMLMVEIKDDGIGFIEKPASKGFGLVGMRERVESAGGVFTIAKNTPGVLLTAIIPITSN
ncbi:histidine kinase [Methyloradius palustris]|uniref:Signal transduction histidine kinase subgroup 3 dimerisation and phosphoacceptor domain-containing protein n=1 Tax=Methyloradius palustris TaxID=2778876 RepID=A0A8D5G1S1_9PROT|nr:histidine kinase [Methyloradius palustris]BCM24503.1 hypothetical protein ZMTM_07620 [Methyloradius palustris]